MGINDKAWDGGFRRAVGDASLGATLALALDTTTKQLHICDIADAGTDWARSASSHPELLIHSATNPATEYIKMYHDATNAYIDGVGATTVQILVAGTSEVSISSSAVAPTTTNGAALGTSSLMWSDLFLASGAVIYFNNTDVTITHSANALTFAGGSYSLNGATTIDGNTSIATGNSFTCDNVTARISQGITGLTTGDAPTFANISLGYAVINGTADYPLNLEDATANVADIKLSNNATIDNHTSGVLTITADNITLSANGSLTLTEANNNAITLPTYIQSNAIFNGTVSVAGGLFTALYMTLTGTADFGIDMSDTTIGKADIKMTNNQRILNVHAASRATARSAAGNDAPLGSIVVGDDARASTKPDVYIKVASNNNDNDWERVVTQASD